MKVLFVGSVIKTEDCLKNLGPSVAGNKMQMGIIKGLKKHFGANLSILTERPIASFPRENVLYINYGIIELTKNIIAKKVPFINIFILKQLSQIFSAFFLICEWIKNNKDEQKVIICFNAFPYIAIPVLWAAKLFNVKSICILADPPIDSVSRGFLGKIAKLIEDKSTKKSIKKFDGLVVLNKNMIAEYAPHSKYIVVDGGFDLEETPHTPCGGQWVNLSSEEPLKVVFSGALIEYNGIVNLIEAAKLVKNPRFVLEIYGSGPLENYVKKISEEESRIIYKGKVSNTEMMKIQQNSALLVNPRPVRDPISMNTFPSKMIEYLVSGTPVVTTKLNGFTEDYFDHMFVFEDESPESMADTIDYILALDRNELIKKATNARQFILKNKNWDVQTDKIIEFMNSLIH